MLHDLYQKYLQYRQVSTDTRTLQKGDLFFALKGDSFNGNQYAEQALEKGASYAIIDQEKYKKNDRYILVDNALETLQKLANLHRKNLTIPVLGLTGSNGKTTTKELIREVLKTTYKVHATQGNLNNHIGVPLTILAMPQDTEIAVIEMGANKIGDIAELCQIAEPTHGFITNIGYAHLEGFGSLEGVLRGKTELYDFLLKNQGTVFINSEDEILANMARRFPAQKLQLYGAKSESHFLEIIPNSTLVKFKTLEGKIYETALTGKYNFSNIQTAQIIGHFFGISTEKTSEAIAKYIPENNRSQLIEGKTNRILADAYNANPSSMRSALENFDKSPAPHKTVILGDMFELGTYALEKHTELIDFLKDSQIQKVILCGKIFGKALQNRDILHFESTSQLNEWLHQNPIQNSYILLKGSRGMGLEILIEVLKKH